MADGASTIDLGPALAARVRVFATAARSDVEAVVRGAVADYLDDWSEALARLAQFDRDGKSADAEPVLNRFQDAVASRAASRAKNLA